MENQLEFEISVRLHYQVLQPCALLLQIEAAPTVDQRIMSRKLTFGPEAIPVHIAAEEGIGERLWLSVSSEIECAYTTKVAVNRKIADVGKLPQSPLTGLVTV